MTEVTSDPIVTMQHVRAAKICAAGVRTFFTRYDLDRRDFLLNGIAASKIIETGDPVAARVVAEAMKESGLG